MRNPKDSKGIVLTKESQRSFDFLTRAITKEPVMLHYPDWDVPFEIHTDASGKAVAAILCQKIKGQERVLMYASKTLLPNEMKYHIYEKHYGRRKFSGSTSGIGGLLSRLTAQHCNGSGQGMRGRV